MQMQLLSFDEKQLLHRFYEIKNCIFLSDNKFTLTKTMKMTKCLSGPDANHYKHANSKMQNLLKQSEISQKSFSFISFLVVQKAHSQSQELLI